MVALETSLLVMSPPIVSVAPLQGTTQACNKKGSALLVLGSRWDHRSAISWNVFDFLSAAATVRKQADQEGETSKRGLIKPAMG